MFIAKQAANLAQFQQADGGFSGTTHSGTGASQYGPAAPFLYSNTDVGGLALKTRDTLNRLANGKVTPLPWAGDERAFAMSGEIGEQLVLFDFKKKSLSAAPGALATTSALTAHGTNSATGTDGDGFHTEHRPLNGVQIGHSGFDDQTSYYEFTLTPTGKPLQLFFLAIWSCNGSETSDENVVLKYSIDGGISFQEANRTSVPGSKTGLIEHAFPLLTIDSLQAIAKPIIFRIHGWNFANEGRTFRIDAIQLFGRAIATETSFSAPASKSAGASYRPLLLN